MANPSYLKENFGCYKANCVFMDPCQMSYGTEKDFHIFDKGIPVALTDIADIISYVCCVLSNFQKADCIVLKNTVNRSRAK